MFSRVAFFSTSFTTTAVSPPVTHVSAASRVLVVVVQTHGVISQTARRSTASADRTTSSADRTIFFTLSTSSRDLVDGKRDNQKSNDLFLHFYLFILLHFCSAIYTIFYSFFCIAQLLAIQFSYKYFFIF